MEHDDLDKRFRDLIQNDDVHLNEQELNSKEAIWERMDKPQKERRVLPFWQIAAAVLLLLLGGTSWFFTNKIDQQNQYYAAVQKELLATKNSLQTVQQEFAKLAPATNNKFENNMFPKVNQPREVVEVLKKEYIEQVVYVRDTVFLVKHILPQEKIKLVRDTVIIEVPTKQPTRFVDLETPPKRQKKKKSQKMEFVFGKKQLNKPTQKSPLILINETEVAKKTDKNNKSNVFTIPINNN